MNPSVQTAHHTDEDDDPIAPVVCPNCGSADLQWTELISQVREVVGIRRGRVLIRDHGETHYEDGQDEHIECLTCSHEFQPDAVNAANGYCYDDN